MLISGYIMEVNTKYMSSSPTINMHAHTKEKTRQWNTHFLLKEFLFLILQCLRFVMANDKIIEKSYLGCLCKSLIKSKHSKKAKNIH